MKKKKGSIVFDSTGWWILGILVFVVVIFIIVALKEKALGALSGFGRILRFGK